MVIMNYYYLGYTPAHYCFCNIKNASKAFLLLANSRDISISYVGIQVESIFRYFGSKEHHWMDATTFYGKIWNNRFN